MKRDPIHGAIIYFLTGFTVLSPGVLYLYNNNEILFFLGIFTGIFIMIYGAFLLLRRYINVLRLIAAVFIVIMWITFFTQPLSSNTNPLLGYILIVLYTILIISLTYYTPKEWKKYKENT